MLCTANVLNALWHMVHAVCEYTQLSRFNGSHSLHINKWWKFTKTYLLIETANNSYPE
jgi:hypothetical protein